MTRNGTDSGEWHTWRDPAAGHQQRDPAAGHQPRDPAAGHQQRDPAAGHQQLVNERFHDRALRWGEVYQCEDLFSVILQHRQARALSWIDALGLPAGSPVLEIGPGAGFMTVELARRGYSVQAADTTP